MPLYLSLLLFSPLLGLLILLCIPSTHLRALKLWANIALGVPLLLCLPLVSQLDRSRGWQFEENRMWIASLGAHYHLGVDGYSLLLLLVTTSLTLLAGLSSWKVIQTRQKEYYAYLLILETGMLGTFLALDFLLFFMFWEVVLIPMYFLIAIWGGPRRAYAGIKFLLYTVLGSVLMLLAGIALAFEHFRQTGAYSLDLADLLRTPVPVALQWWIFAGLFAGFAVKVPMFPFHTWLPDAHVEAPTAASVLLAGVLLKMGAYGFLRFAWPLTPDVVRSPQAITLLVTLSIVAIIYGALLCLMQRDWKKLVAYSSVSHMGYATLGMTVLTPLGIQGSMLEQVNHALSTGLLFLLVGAAYERRGTREIAAYSGLFRVMPLFTICFLVAVLSSMGMPAFNGFIGELAILTGTAERSMAWAAWGVVGLILGAAYLLWLFQRTSLGETLESNMGMPDLNRRELAICVPLVLAMIAIGLYPQPLFNLVAHPAQQIIQRVHP